jgi:hypothetical protein
VVDIGPESPKDEMVNSTEMTKMAPHGMFYMEGAGGRINEARPTL